MAAKMDVDRHVSEFGLYDFPDEILLPIMTQLDDMTLFNMTLVCRRFRAIAKDAFSKKYTGKGDEGFFELKLRCNNPFADKVKHRPYFATFGEDMAAIRIVDYSRNVDLYHWLIGQIRNCCKTLRHASIFGGKEINLGEFIRCVPTLSHLYLKSVKLLNQSWAESNYPRLIGFDAADMRLDERDMVQFINNNRQLEELSLKGRYNEMDMHILHSLGGILPKLKSLCLDYPVWRVFDEEPDSIELNSLETFEISGHASFMEILGGMTSCQNLRKISMKANEKWDESVFDALGRFKKLESLKMSAYDLKPGQLEYIVEQLPRLSKLYLVDVHIDGETDFYEFILHSIRIGKKLAYLEISSNEWEPELSYPFIAELGKITKHNPLKFSLIRYNERITSQRGEVRSKDSVLYWDGYDAVHSQSATNLLDLSDECLQRIVSVLSINDHHALFNTCQKARQVIKDAISQNGLRLLHADIFWPKTNGKVEEKVFQSLGPHIHRVQIDGWYSWSSGWHVYHYLNQYCPNLGELSMVNMSHIDRFFFNGCLP
ncbi:uncharacterized protein LOC129565533 isoform X1 [Sitodiplosis mosellana]|nr:uncharacterized protein LOC129565533 isoform X1 [Sitodiplosis mosellana]XP_055296492.1 uncharacterized protein LOC129565533 isoform X1 [Sitodiplosis mosellana]